MEEFSQLLSDMLSHDASIWKPAKKKYLDMTVHAKLMCFFDYCLPDVRHVPIDTDGKMILAAVLYHILRRSMVDSLYPKIPVEEKTVLGRRMELFGQFIENSYNWRHKKGTVSSAAEYRIFNDIFGLGSISDLDFAKALQNTAAFPNVHEFMQFLTRKFSYYHHLPLFIIEWMKHPLYVISALDMRSQEFIDMKMGAMKICFVLCLRHDILKEAEALSMLTQSLKIAMKDVISVMKFLTQITFPSYYDNGCYSAYIIHNVVLFRPSLILPASEEFYKLTIELLLCYNKALQVSQIVHLDMFVAFAENYPEKVKEIGRKAYMPRKSNSGTLCYEEMLISAIFASIKNSVDGDSIDGNGNFSTYQNIVENVSNLERFAKVIGGDIIWKHVESYLHLAYNCKHWRIHFTALIIISYLGEECSDQIKNSISKIMYVLQFAVSNNPNKIMKVVICHTIAQLCIDFGSEYLRKWQNEFFVETLLHYIRDFGGIVPWNAFPLRALGLCSENCLTPALKKYLPELLEAVRSNLWKPPIVNRPNTFSPIYDEAKATGVKTFCTLVKTAKCLIRPNEVKQFRKVIHKLIHKYNLMLYYNMDTDYLHDMHYVYIDGLIQMLKAFNHPRLIRNIQMVMEYILRRTLNTKFPLPYDESVAQIDMKCRTFPCPAVYILGKISTESLPLFHSVVLPKMSQIIELAEVEYLEIFREYSCCAFQTNDNFTMESRPLLEECLKGKEYACKALLNFAKSESDFFTEVGLPKVIHAMMMNVSDRMHSVTQESAAEALVLLLHKLKSRNRKEFDQLHRKAILCLMEAARIQRDPTILLSLIRRMIDVEIMTGPSNDHISFKLEFKELISSRLEYALQYVENYRQLETMGPHVKSKSRLVREIQQSCKSLMIEAFNILH